MFYEIRFQRTESATSVLLSYVGASIKYYLTSFLFMLIVALRKYVNEGMIAYYKVLGMLHQKQNLDRIYIIIVTEFWFLDKF